MGLSMVPIGGEEMDEQAIFGALIEAGVSERGAQGLIDSGASAEIQQILGGMPAADDEGWYTDDRPVENVTPRGVARGLRQLPGNIWDVTKSGIDWLTSEAVTEEELEELKEKAPHDVDRGLFDVIDPFLDEIDRGWMEGGSDWTPHSSGDYDPTRPEEGKADVIPTTHESDQPKSDGAVVSEPLATDVDPFAWMEGSPLTPEVESEPEEEDDGTGIKTTLSTHGGKDTATTELQQGDRDSGGEGKKEAFRTTGLAPGARGKFLDWLGHDEESGTRLGNSLMTAGGAILSSRAPHWSQALGEGIEAGTADYQRLKKAGLNEEVERQRMNLAQQRMERERRKENRQLAKDAQQQAWDVAEKQREGWIVDDQGNPVEWSEEKYRKYNPGEAYKSQSSTGKMLADMDQKFNDLVLNGMDPTAAREYVRWLFRSTAGFGKDQGIIPTGG